MSGEWVPGHCGVHGKWAQRTVPIGEDHGSGSTPAARICLHCARHRIDSDTASTRLLQQVETMPPP